MNKLIALPPSSPENVLFRTAVGVAPSCNARDLSAMAAVCRSWNRAVAGDLVRRYPVSLPYSQRGRDEKKNTDALAALRRQAHRDRLEIEHKVAQLTAAFGHIVPNECKAQFEFFARHTLHCGAQPVWRLPERNEIGTVLVEEYGRRTVHGAVRRAALIPPGTPPPAGGLPAARPDGV